MPVALRARWRLFFHIKGGGLWASCSGAGCAACPVPAEPESGPTWLVGSLGLRGVEGWVGDCASWTVPTARIVLLVP